MLDQLSGSSICPSLCVQHKQKITEIYGLLHTPYRGTRLNQGAGVPVVTSVFIREESECKQGSLDTNSVKRLYTEKLFSEKRTSKREKATTHESNRNGISYLGYASLIYHCCSHPSLGASHWNALLTRLSTGDKTAPLARAWFSIPPPTAPTSSLC